MLTKHFDATAYRIDPKARHCDGSCDFLVKTAGIVPESVEYFKNLTPDPDKIYMLVIGMTSSEFYGANKNGDYFREADLKKYYKDFENAGIFWNHDNKDMSKSSGKVTKAFYNDIMHRVELVMEIPKENARYIPNYIETGKPIAVSMGLRTPCFIAGTHVIMSDGGSKPIEDVKIGDKVLTTNGNFKKVVGVSKTPYFGEMVEIQPRVGNKITGTSEHPFQVIDFRKLGYNNKHLRLTDVVNLIKEKLDNEENIFEWVEAGMLDPDKHILVNTIRSKNIEFDDYINESVARILGYYLAEGHILKKSDRNGKNQKNIAVVFSCHKDDNLIKEIDELMRKSNIQYTNITVTKSNTSDKVRIVTVYSHQLAELCLEYCGQYAHTKVLSEKIFKWPDNIKKHFLGAYTDGDGHVSKSKSHYGHLTISTTNEYLATQIQSLFISLGLQCSRNRLNHMPSGKVKKRTIEHVITLGAHAAQELYGYCSKIFKIKHKGKNSSRKKYYDDYGFTFIKKINKFHFEGFVYNLEIEDDHTYIVEHVNVHNCEFCSICGHKTTGSYDNRCHHLKFEMNKVYDDGRRVYAISGVPYKIFDISIVFRPADRTAYAMLTKS